MNPATLPSFFTSFLAVLTGIGSLPAVVAKPPAPAAIVGSQDPVSRLDPPFEGYDARLRDQLRETRLPLEPQAALGASRVLLVGDRPHLAQGRAWLIQNVAAFKKAGVTHLGFELLRADQQTSLDAYRDGQLSRAALLARLLGRNDGAFRYSRRISFEETVSLVDAATLAGLQVVALGHPEADEEAVFKELTGLGKRQLRAAGRARYQLSLRDIRAPLDRVRSDDLAERIAGLLAAGGASRVVVLATPGRLSRYSTAGRLWDMGLSPRTCGFFFPEQDELNVSLKKIGRSIRAPDTWSYVPLDPEDAGMDALLLAPAALPQPPLR